MIVTATDFKNNIGKYISVSKKEDIIVTKNGKYIARLVGFEKSGTPLTDSLIGVIRCTGDIDLKKEQEERIGKK